MQLQTVWILHARLTRDRNGVDLTGEELWLICECWREDCWEEEVEFGERVDYGLGGLDAEGEGT